MMIPNIKENFDYTEFEILIVDDIPANLQVLGNMLKEYGLKISLADNGLKAINTAVKRQPDLILMDINMPIMDGFEACKEIKKYVTAKDIPIIFITARNSPNDIVEGFRAGGSDYVTKPFNQSELMARITTQLKLIKSQKALIYSYNVMKSDLLAAAKLQKDSLPKNNEIINGYKFSRLFMPSVFLSGDTLHYFPIGANYIGFYLIDVSGHGIPAALMAFTLGKTLTPSLIQHNPLIESDSKNNYTPKSPAKLIFELNNEYESKVVTDEYFTAVYGIIDQNEKTLAFCTAGHPLPLLAINGKAEQIGEEGFPAGMFRDMEYTESTIKLNGNERIVIYSDGLTECMNNSGQQFSLERLKEIIQEHADKTSEEFIKQLRFSLEEWSGGADYDDDISMLVIDIPMLL